MLEQKGRNHAPLFGGEIKKGIPESTSGSLQNNERAGLDEGEQDHPVGQTGAGEARQGQQSGQAEEVRSPLDCLIYPEPKPNQKGYAGEQWRGTVGRVTYRVTITVPTNLLPSRLLLERLISHAGETEAWEAEWGIK